MRKLGWVCELAVRAVCGAVVWSAQQTLDLVTPGGPPRTPTTTSTTLESRRAGFRAPLDDWGSGKAAFELARVFREVPGDVAE